MTHFHQFQLQHYYARYIIGVMKHPWRKWKQVGWARLIFKFLILSFYSRRNRWNRCVFMVKGVHSQITITLKAYNSSKTSRKQVRMVWFCSSWCILLYFACYLCFWKNLKVPWTGETLANFFQKINKYKIQNICKNHSHWSQT